LDTAPTAKNFEAVASALEQSVGHPEWFNGLLFYVLRGLFTSEAGAVGVDQERFRVERLWPIWLTFLKAHFGTGVFTTPESRSEPDRVAIIAPQLLGNLHSPTRVALEYARALHVDLGYRVLVVDSEQLPTTPVAPIPQPFVANRRPTQERQANLLQVDDARLIVWRPKEERYSRSKVVEAVRAVEAFKPKIVLSYNDWNAVGDVLAQRYPVLQVPARRGHAMSRGHGYLYPKRRERDVPSPLLVGQDGMYLPYSFMPIVSETPSPCSRSDLGLQDEGQVYVIVGNRLDSEISERFALMVRRLLEEDPSAQVLVVGRGYGGSIEAGAPERLGKRVVSLPVRRDLEAVFSVCDVFLNPFRQGGGISAFLAMDAGLAIMTCGGSDVANTAPRSAIHSDEAAYEAALLALARDPDQVGVSRAASRTRRAEIGLLRERSDELLRAVEHTCARFKEVSR